MWMSLCECADLEDRECGQRGYNYVLLTHTYIGAERTSGRSVVGLYTTLTLVLLEAVQK